MVCWMNNDVEIESTGGCTEHREFRTETAWHNPMALSFLKKR